MGIRFHCPYSDHDANRNRQIKGGTFLFHVSGSEIDGDSPGFHFPAAVDNSGVDPVLAFTHRSIRKADDLHAGHAVNAEHFNTDLETADTADAKADRSGHNLSH